MNKLPTCPDCGDPHTKEEGCLERTPYPPLRIEDFVNRQRESIVDHAIHEPARNRRAGLGHGPRSRALPAGRRR